jgi:uncharacterized protein
MSHIPELIVITALAALVNGALGYGFSSITVPLALVFIASRTLNPALVGLEVALNAYVLWTNRDAVPRVLGRVTPVAGGLLPGVLAGTTAVALVTPEWLKLWTFSLLLPLIVLQAVGFRRPLRSERAWGVLFGAALGGLYSLTTISGPPLAMALNNQGLAKRDFRAALAIIRLTEATLTAMAYAYAGVFTRESLVLASAIVPSLLIGVPAGAWLIRRVDADLFRRVCMSFDAWIVGFGLCTVLRALHLADAFAAYSIFAIVIAVDAVLLYRFVSLRRALGGHALAA